MDDIITILPKLRQHIVLTNEMKHADDDHSRRRVEHHRFESRHPSAVSIEGELDVELGIRPTHVVHKRRRWSRSSGKPVARYLRHTGAAEQDTIHLVTQELRALVGRESTHQNE